MLSHPCVQAGQMLSLRVSEGSLLISVSSILNLDLSSIEVSKTSRPSFLKFFLRFPEKFVVYFFVFARSQFSELFSSKNMELIKKFQKMPTIIWLLFLFKNNAVDKNIINFRRKIGNLKCDTKNTKISIQYDKFLNLKRTQKHAKISET